MVYGIHANYAYRRKEHLHCVISSRDSMTNHLHGNLQNLLDVPGIKATTTKKYYMIYLISQIKNKREKQRISQKCFTYQSFIAHQQWVSIVDGGWQHLTWCSNFLPIFQMIINYLLASTVIGHPMFGNGALTFQNETITATFLSHGLRRRRWTEQHKRHIKDQCRNEVFQPLMSSNDFDVYTYIFITLFAERIQFFLLIFENL